MSLEPNAKQARIATDSVEKEMDHDSERIARVLSNDPLLQLEATTKFRKILPNETLPTESVIESGAVPRLVQFLNKEDSPKLQYEAVWVITDIACDKPEEVTDHGAVPVLVQLLASPNDDVLEQAKWGSVAGGSTENRDHVLSCGVLLPHLNVNTKFSMLTSPDGFNAINNDNLANGPKGFAECKMLENEDLFVRMDLPGVPEEGVTVSLDPSKKAVIVYGSVHTHDSCDRKYIAITGLVCKCCDISGFTSHMSDGVLRLLVSKTSIINLQRYSCIWFLAGPGFPEDLRGTGTHNIPYGTDPHGNIIHLCELMVYPGAASSAVALFVDPLFEAMGEQNIVLQSGAAMCMAGMVITSFQKIYPRICKVLRNIDFLAKDLPLVSSLSQHLPRTGNTSISEIEGNQSWNERFLKEHNISESVEREIQDTKPCSNIFRVNTKNDKVYMLWEVPEEEPSQKLFAENWEEFSGPVRDQRSHDNCSTYVGTDLFSAMRLITKKDDKFRIFSARYLTFYASPMLRHVESTEGSRKDQHHCHGNTIAATLKFIKENGVPEEDPIDGEKDFNCITDAPDQYPKILYKIDDEVEVCVSNKLKDLYEALLQQPVGANLHFFHPEFTNIGSDIYEGPLNGDSKYSGLHTVSVIAVKRNRGKLVAVVKSSHGKEKGKKGYMEVSLTKMILGVGRGNEIYSPSFLLTDFTYMEIRRGLNKPEELKKEKRKKRKYHHLPCLAFPDL